MPDEPTTPPQPPAPRRPANRIPYYLAGAAVLSAGLFAYGYVRCSRVIDKRLAKGPLAGTVNIYAAPKTIAVGDELTPQELASRLRRSGLSGERTNPVGWFQARPGAVEIYPGPDSVAGADPAVVRFAGGRIAAIVSLADNSARDEYALQPQLLSNISDSNHDRRRPVRFSQIPPVLVHAIISAEDKRFFEHGGIDVFRSLKAAWVDLRSGRKEQGASTISMQLARGLWLTPNKRWKRKFEEVLITLYLEHKLTKDQIFEDYCNQVYLGRQGPFNIQGFGEAARAYFDREIGQLTLDQAALLAGLVQRPSYYNPLRYPDRARERRNVVLALMRDNGYIGKREYLAAANAPVMVARDRRPHDAPYFVDLVNDRLQSALGDQESGARYVYTTLDADLQRAAEEAVRDGMARVDRLLRRRKGIRPGEPQVALIALDPQTGAVRALVGGRNYDTSQVDHALAERQPGSVFKPFVYAAALNSAVDGGSTRIFTPASLVEDEPASFHFGGRTYAPNNFKGEFMGTVTLREALAHSLNVATVKVAQEVGYDRVVAMARRCGFTSALEPTPALALGSYTATPLEVAGAYTVFANQGEYVQPNLITLVRAPNATALYSGEPEQHRALDPRVNYLMVSMLEDVLREGTGTGVRAMGFRAPAAGKTGTSKDGWFAGFTTQLVTVVWVGFDDGRDLNLEGAQAALPIWTEFMMKALAGRPYRDAQEFARPDGVVTASVCGGQGCLEDVFLDGTQPQPHAQVEAVPEQTEGTDADRAAPPAIEQPSTQAAPEQTQPATPDQPPAPDQSSDQNDAEPAPPQDSPPAQPDQSPPAQPDQSHPAQPDQSHPAQPDQSHPAQPAPPPKDSQTDAAGPQ